MGPRLLALLASAALTGCTGDRILRIETDPPGATVRLDDTVIGVTPIDVAFEHYGRRRLSLYRTGFRTYAEPLVLEAPWFARWPLDMLTEVILPLGLDDVRTLRVDLVADAGIEAAAATEEFLDHARRARAGETLEGVRIAGDERKGDGTDGD